jgi:hypothetical protein
MAKIESFIGRFSPSPGTCFILSLLFLLFGTGMASTYTVLRKRLDEQGHFMLAPNGRPLVEVDQWASFWNGWPSNIPVIIAVAFFLLGIALWIRNKHFKKQQPR